MTLAFNEVRTACMKITPRAIPFSKARFDTHSYLPNRDNKRKDARFA